MVLFGRSRNDSDHLFLYNSISLPSFIVLQHGVGFVVYDDYGLVGSIDGVPQQPGIRAFERFGGVRVGVKIPRKFIDPNGVTLAK